MSPPLFTKHVSPTTPFSRPTSTASTPATSPSIAGIATTNTNITPDTDELAKFRKRWKEEVRDRERGKERNHGKVTGSSSATATAETRTAENMARDGQLLVGNGQDVGLRASTVSTRRTDVQVGSGIGIDATPSSLSSLTLNVPEVSFTQPLPQHPQRHYRLPAHSKSALALYTNAILEEQRGNCAEATRLYRRAFQLDSNVDKIHHREESAKERSLLSRLENESSVSMAAKTSSSSAARSPPPSVALHFGHLKLEPSETHPHPSPRQAVDPDRESHRSHPFDLLPLVLSWVDSAPEFLPSDERLPLPLSKLPGELIIYILRTFVWNVDAASIERFALACRKTRTLSLDQSIWRKFLEINLVRYQLSQADITIDDLCFGLYKSDYRRMFIEHPRIRFDGVYIAICHYVRNGLGESPWVAISHLITYRRFLRFFPNGKVLSYQANEDQEISEVVHSLQLSLSKQDVRVGDWRLLGTWLYITNLENVVPSRFRNMDKFNFQMRLSLKSRPCLGRWNKLDILDYESMDVETGDISPFALRNERPYWFSKVRSYTF